MKSVFPVNITSLGTPKEVDFSLSYDPVVLSNPVVSLGPNVGGNLQTTVAPGAVGLTITNAVIPAGTGLLATITFDVADGLTGMTPLTWNKTPIYPNIVGPSSNPNLSYGANTGLIDLATGAPQAVNIQVLLETQSPATAVVVGNDPNPTPSVNPVPMPGNNPPAQVVPVPTSTPTTLTRVPILTPFPNLLASLTAHPVLLALGGGALLYMLSGKKKGRR